MLKKDVPIRKNDTKNKEIWFSSVVNWDGIKTATSHKTDKNIN